jgi:hypothetical protein
MTEKVLNERGNYIPGLLSLIRKFMWHRMFQNFIWLWLSFNIHLYMHKPNLEETAFIWHDKRQHKSTDGFQRESLLEKHDNRWQHKVSICLRRVGSVFIRLNWFRFTAWELIFLGAAINVGHFVERPNTPLLCPFFGFLLLENLSLLRFYAVWTVRYVAEDRMHSYSGSRSSRRFTSRHDTTWVGGSKDSRNSVLLLLLSFRLPTQKSWVFTCRSLNNTECLHNSYLRSSYLVDPIFYPEFYDYNKTWLKLCLVALSPLMLIHVTDISKHMPCSVKELLWWRQHVLWNIGTYVLTRLQSVTMQKAVIIMMTAIRLSLSFLSLPKKHNVSISRISV